MKKVLFVIMAVVLISAASSCKKCGYCKYPSSSGQSNSSTICKQNGALGSVDNSYDQAQGDCQSQGGAWVNTK